MGDNRFFPKGGDAMSRRVLVSEHTENVPAEFFRTSADIQAVKDDVSNRFLKAMSEMK